MVVLSAWYPFFIMTLTFVLKCSVNYKIFAIVIVWVRSIQGFVTDQFILFIITYTVWNYKGKTNHTKVTSWSHNLSVYICLIAGATYFTAIEGKCRDKCPLGFLPTYTNFRNLTYFSCIRCNSTKCEKVCNFRVSPMNANAKRIEDQPWFGCTKVIGDLSIVISHQGN